MPVKSACKYLKRFKHSVRYGSKIGIEKGKLGKRSTGKKKKWNLFESSTENRIAETIRTFNPNFANRIRQFFSRGKIAIDPQLNPTKFSSWSVDKRLVKDAIVYYHFDESSVGSPTREASQRIEIPSSFHGKSSRVFAEDVRKKERKIKSRLTSAAATKTALLYRDEK